MTQNVGSPKNVTATGVVWSAPGYLLGVLVNASSSGTLTLYDNTAASGTKIATTLSVTAGQYVPIPAALAVGLHCTIGGTADVTFFIGI